MVVEKKSGDFKTVEIHLPSWMYSKVALAVMVVVLIAGFIWMTPGLNTAVFGTPVKTATGPPEVKTAEVQTAENAAVDAATGAVTIPADAYEITHGIESKFSINQYPQNFLVTSRNVLYTNVVIGSKEISGTFTILDEEKTTKAGGVGGFFLYFYKEGKLLGGNNIIPKTYTLSEKRKPETLSADTVIIQAN